MKKLAKICSAAMAAAMIVCSTFSTASLAAENTSMGAIKVSNYLNVRSQPSTDGAVIGQLVNNDVVEITGKTGNWYIINISGQTAYISADYVTVVSSEEASKLIKEAQKKASSTTAGQKIVSTAKQYIGTPYVYGGSSPSGFDCSGFTSYVYSKHGVSIPRTSSAQSASGTKVAKSSLKEGDLVFFGCGSSNVNHVGIYVGGGQFIHSPSADKTVRIESLNSGYYAKTYISASRVVK